MKKKELYTNLIRARIIATFFAFLMVSVTVVQNMHHHHQETECCNHVNQKKITNHSSHCIVCDHFQYRSNYYALVVPDIEITACLPSSIVHGGYYYMDVYRLALQMVANKAPPSIFVTA